MIAARVYDKLLLKRKSLEVSVHSWLKLICVHPQISGTSFSFNSKVVRCGI